MMLLLCSQNNIKTVKRKLDITMGISSDRAYKIQRILIARVIDIYGCAKSFKSTHEYILDRMTKEVWNSKEIKKAPKHVGAYVSGYREAISDSFWRNELVWMLSLDGKLVSSKEVSIITDEERCMGAKEGMFPFDKTPYLSPYQRVDSDHSCHVYKGTLIPFDEKHRLYWEEKNKMLSDSSLKAALQASPWETAQKAV